MKISLKKLIKTHTNISIGKIWQQNLPNIHEVVRSPAEDETKDKNSGNLDGVDL